MKKNKPKPKSWTLDKIRKTFVPTRAIHQQFWDTLHIHSDHDILVYMLCRDITYEVANYSRDESLTQAIANFWLDQLQKYRRSNITIIGTIPAIKAELERENT